MNAATDFPRLLEMFFTTHLIQHRRASPHTIASSRNAFRLLVKYAWRKLKKPPSQLAMADLDATFLGGFLSHLGNERGNEARTRNARLAAVRSFFRFAALQEPQHAALAQRVLALPDKRHVRQPVDFLERREAETLIQSTQPKQSRQRPSSALNQRTFTNGGESPPIASSKVQGSLLPHPLAISWLHGASKHSRACSSCFALPAVALLSES